MVSFLLYVLAISTAGCGGSGGKHGTGTHGVIWSDGTWLRDRQGRVIILHGINVSDAAKHPPYMDFTATALTGDALEQDLEKNFARISGLGLDAVRLIVVWAGLEPTPGVIDPGYLGMIRQEVQACADNGLFVLIDMHQDLYGMPFCGGEGAPQWASYMTGFSPSQCSQIWAVNYAIPQVRQSFQDLWDDRPAPDGTGLQEHYASAFQTLARAFSGTANVLAYEIMNEPFPGNYSLAAPDFETQALVPFYGKVIKAIRAVDPGHVVAFEPSVALTNLLNDYNTAISTTTFTGGFPDLMFVPHFYPLSADPSYGTDTAIIIPSFDQIKNDGIAMKTPCAVDEMGTGYDVPDSARYMVTVFNDFDAFNAGWFDWDYNVANDDDMSPYYPDGTPRYLTDKNGTPAFPGIDVISRPYPLLTAGTPVSISYPVTADPSTFTTTTFTYTYKEDGIGTGTTEIFVPPLHFPNGFTVTVSDGAVDFNATTHLLGYTRGPRSSHTITMVPCGPGDTNCVDDR